MRLPSRTPAGMLTLIRLTVRRAPEPLQVGQGSSITVPEPWQLEHGWEIEKIPWLWDSTPRPWQTGHTRGEVPGFAPEPWQVGHGWEVGTESETCAPPTACAKLSETSVSRSRPRVGAARAVRPPRPEPRAPAPPNRFERMSPKLPPNWLGSKPPAPPRPPRIGPRSYARRLSGSDSTSCACEICLKRSSACLSPGLRSGWYWRARRRYAFLISSAEAFRPTPRIL